ncbi:MAG: ChbG/HpnK family deacetylase [Bacteroidota bacterium]
MRLLPLVLALLAGLPPLWAQAQWHPDTAYVLVRSDDLGMNHAANRANALLADSGLPFSASVMFATPWYLEAVEILRARPHIAVGIHLTLNAEWQWPRWGPITGTVAAPSLVDSSGYFHAGWDGLFANDGPSLAEVETELRAQIDRAIQTGLPICYVDAHMGAARATPELRALTARLADAYGLGISGDYGENRFSIYAAAPDAKPDSLLARLSRLEPGRLHLFVSHLGLETDEMQALADQNPGGLAEVAAHRRAELRALTDARLHHWRRTAPVRFITYADLLRRQP